MPPVRLFPRRHSAHLLLIATILALLIVPRSAHPATRSVTDANKGGSVQLKLGDILEVHLRSNPTTGYMWYVHPKSTPLLKLIGQSQTQAPQPGVGRPIFQIFRFQAVSAGEGILLLHYVRAWERPMAAEEQFDLRVSIR
jgi:predicted secreted protein